MADNKQHITNTYENGTIIISEDVIGTIVCRAIEEVEGVVALSNSGKKNWSKSIKITIIENNTITVECNIHVVYGQNIVNVASAVQDAISGAVSSMTGVKVEETTVNVSGVVRK